DLGRRLAIRVMRKHRLAECLLTQVIDLPWEEIHVEACRWEHVMSEAVETRLVDLLGNPQFCPHGNRIPGLAESGVKQSAMTGDEAVSTMASVAGPIPITVVVRRISEQGQSDPAVMLKLKQVGIQP